MKDQRQDIDGLAQEDSFLTSPNTVVMLQLAQLTAAMGEIQEQIKKFTTNTKTKRKYYCWSCSRNLKRSSRHFPNRMDGHKDEAH